jgi:hypothetical protein
MCGIGHLERFNLWEALNLGSSEDGGRTAMETPENCFDFCVSN